MSLTDLIPGVKQAKLIVFAIGAAAVVGLGIWAYLYVTGLQANAAHHKKQFEEQLVENGKLSASLETAIATAKSASDSLKESIEELKASDARAEDYRRQRDLFWRKVNGIDLTNKEDGPLAPGVLDGLVQLCGIEAGSGRTCSAFDRETNTVHAPDQPGKP